MISEWPNTRIGSPDDVQACIYCGLHWSNGATAFHKPNRETETWQVVGR